jgi:hypothetical protein
VSARAARAAFVLSLALAGLCREVRAAGSAFDAARAHKDLEALVALGPRRAGSDAAQRARGLIRERLRQAGWSAHEESFAPLAGAVSGRLANVVGERRGKRDRLVVLATHFDSGDGPDANESASGPAVLLELGRSLAAREPQVGLRLAFLDAHEPLAGSVEGLQGSRALALRMERAGELKRLEALIVIERVSDPDLELDASVLSSPRLVALAQAAARPLEPPALLAPLPRAHFASDHLPFARRGARELLALTDLHFGPGDAPGAWSHTPEDTSSRASADSLGRVGRWLESLVAELER